MVEIKLVNRKVDDVLLMVRELREQGLVQGQDFDFRWVPPRNDWLSEEEPSATSFYFYTEENATLFSLKYSL